MAGNIRCVFGILYFFSPINLAKGNCDSLRLTYKDNLLAMQQCIEMQQAADTTGAMTRYWDSLWVLVKLVQADYTAASNRAALYLATGSVYFHAVHHAGCYFAQLPSYADVALLLLADSAWSNLPILPKEKKSSGNIILLASMVVPGMGHALQGNWKRAGTALVLSFGFGLATVGIASGYGWVYAGAVVLPWWLRYHVGSALKARNAYYAHQRQSDADAIRKKVLSLQPLRLYLE